MTEKLTSVNHDELVARAASILKSGGVIVLPTDTVYGLAAHPAFPDSLRRIYDIKGRSENKPVAFLASDPDAPVKFGAEFSPAGEKLAAAFWPGALTIVADCHGTTEGFRVPDMAVTREIIAACGGLLRVTSANLSGEEAATSASHHSVASIASKCDLVIDNGPCPCGTASTVVRVKNGECSILRAGSITEEMLSSVLKSS